MTNGGLQTIRSKSSPATGSYIEPARRSQCWPFSRAVAAGQGQRPRVDVGGDHRPGVRRPGAAPGCRSRCPGPGPGRPARRITALASVTDAAPTPSTWSRRTGPGLVSESRSETSRNSSASAECGRMSRAARNAPPSRSSTPCAMASATPVRGQRPADGRLVLGGAEQEQPDQGGQRRAVPGGPQRGREFAAAERPVGADAEQFRHAVGVVAGCPQVRAEPVE